MPLIALYIEDHSFWSADLLSLLCSLIQNKEVFCYQVVYTKTQQYFDIHIFSSLCLYKIPLFVSEVKCRVRLCDPMDYRVHGILQARILEWVACPFSRGSSQPGDRTQVSCIVGRFIMSWATREAQEYWHG